MSQFPLIDYGFKLGKRMPNSTAVLQFNNELLSWSAMYEVSIVKDHLHDATLVYDRLLW